MNFRSFTGSTCTLNRFFMTRDNHLAWRVKVYRRNDLTFSRFFTGFSDRRIIQTDDGRHAARALWHRFG